MNDRVRRGLGGQGLGQEQHRELPLLLPSPPMTSSITASQLPLPTPPSLPTLPPTASSHLHTNDPPISWGVGDRTGMFLLVLRSLALLQRIPITTKHIQQPTNPLSSAPGQGLETSLEEVCGRRCSLDHIPIVITSKKTERFHVWLYQPNIYQPNI